MYAPTGADIPGLNVVAVEVGATFTAAGLLVTAVGGRHAPVRAGQPSCANVGYAVENRLYHPGDALDVPPVPVHTLLVPMQAAWLKTAEAIEFVHAIAPSLAVGIHDAQINDRGRASINGWLEEESDTDYRWLPPGTPLET